MSLRIILLMAAWTAMVAAAAPRAAPAKPVPASDKNVQPNDPIEREYRKLLEDDDAAQEEADKWIREANDPDTASPLSKATLTARIRQRFAPIRKAYEDFLRRHPKHVNARIAFGSFLNETGDEEEAVVQWEKAKAIDPNNPAIWNNLANNFGHRGPVEKAFQHYEKAIELNPKEPVYYENLATTVYLYRKDAMAFYKLNEAEVFDRALDLYRKALKLDPKNFPLATDLAQSFYGIKPMRVEEAIAAWNYALSVANDEIEREGVYLHLARVELNSGRFEQARSHLAVVTNQMYAVLKLRLEKNLAAKESKAKESNAPPAKATEPR